MRHCKGNGSLYLNEHNDDGCFVKDKIVVMLFGSKYDTGEYTIFLDDGWYSYEYLDVIIDEGKAELTGRYTLWGERMPLNATEE